MQRCSALGVALVSFVAWSCGDAPTIVIRRPPPSLQAIELATYDGSGQAVHPDVAWLAHPGADVAPFLVATPYPQGNARYENPSLYAGDGLARWGVPGGLTNPIVRPAQGYLSDPDMLYDPESGELWTYYRQVTAENEIWLVRSSDGVRWSPPVRVAHAANHTIISPTVVRRAAGDWLMWSVNAGPAGCTADATTVELRRSRDGLTWSAPQTVSLTQDGGTPWHIDVEWIASRQEFWAVYPLKQSGSCTTAALFFARSADGVHWQTYSGPVLRRGANPELQDVVYRSSIGYDPATDLVTLWYSGARFEGHEYLWHLAAEQLSSSALQGRLELSAASDPSLPAPTPPLTNATAP